MICSPLCVLRRVIQAVTAKVAHGRHISTNATQILSESSVFRKYHGAYWTSLNVPATLRENVQTRYRVLSKGQLKEQDGFLVSKSVTLASAPPRGGALIKNFYIPTKRVPCLLTIHVSITGQLIGSQDVSLGRVGVVFQAWKYHHRHSHLYPLGLETLAYWEKIVPYLSILLYTITFFSQNGNFIPIQKRA